MDNKTPEIKLKPVKIVSGFQWNQKQDIYKYQPNEKCHPVKIAEDLISFMENLDQNIDSQKNIYNQLKLGLDNQAKEELIKTYLAKEGYYLNPTLKDFQEANLKAGLSKKTNLQNVTEAKISIEKTIVKQFTKEKDEKEVQAKKLLKEFGYSADSSKTVNKMKNLISNQEKYNRQTGTKKPVIESIREQIHLPEYKEYLDKTFKRRAKRAAMLRRAGNERI